MQIISQETFFNAENQGQQFLDSQFSMIQCINDWRIKIFQTFNLNIDNYIPCLQLDIQLIKSQLLLSENSGKINFILGQISVMDILRMNFKSCQKRLKQFLQENQGNISYNLACDLVKNSQTLKEYFNYEQSIQSCDTSNQVSQYSQQNFSENQTTFEEQLDGLNSNNANGQTVQQASNAIDFNDNEIQIDFDFDNNSSQHSQELFDDFLEADNEQQNQENQYFCNNNNNYQQCGKENMIDNNNNNADAFNQHFILLQ
ncbi:hypothetical protein TTHERM_01028790 (macronuclear) [Tetrahymena thermophila SB210]|uniref:Uncharacterized protein n=1 Tax=Tetrahymena thermophila (strain SB210) TaxID=312017 RepID=Q23EG1_TETTS|nr:hypothetical protein TTHERM_01028790 [Tetrahymena thermophila SB210]EAR94896.3 hypothetical protein TTHERM_01028790 [Tetrahymena thermophila SB210]|eukprot:XP_001015141.3 hypothetical protein TTHERM_01028790 [Tetrahymena thermophila SB210]